MDKNWFKKFFKKNLKKFKKFVKNTCINFKNGVIWHQSLTERSVTNTQNLIKMSKVLKNLKKIKKF